MYKLFLDTCYKNLNIIIFKDNDVLDYYSEECNKKQSEYLFTKLDELLYSTYFEDRIFLKSSDFYLYFHDLWSLFEIGQKYKQNIVEENVRLKDWRIFILEFFASRNLEKMQFEYLTNSSVKKFLISLYI